MDLSYGSVHSEPDEDNSPVSLATIKTTQVMEQSFKTKASLEDRPTTVEAGPGDAAVVSDKSN